jgi:hypothetical protein
MTELTDALARIAPPPKRLNTRGRLALSLRHGAGMTYVRLSREAVTVLKVPRYVRLLEGRGRIAVAPTDAADRYARRVQRDNSVRCPDLADRLCLRAGDAFVIDVERQDGMLVGELPPALFYRRAQRDRREQTS